MGQEEDLEWDEIWEPAFEKFLWPADGKSDPKPLAELLRSDRPLRSTTFRLVLAGLIDPPKYPLFNEKLVVQHTRRASIARRRNDRNFEIATTMAEELKKHKTVEEAAYYAGKKLGLSDRQVIKIWKPLAVWRPKWFKPNSRSGD